MLIYTNDRKVTTKGGNSMMGMYPKIAVRNVCVVDVCFRMMGKLYNEGKIIVDIDSYDFAGYLTDDVIIGLYEDGKYNIQYYYKNYNFDGDIRVRENEIGYQLEEYLIELSTELKKTIPNKDFVSNELCFKYGTDMFFLSFNTIISEQKEIERVLESNMDLLKPKS